MKNIIFYNSKVGKLGIVEENEAIIAITFGEKNIPDSKTCETPLIKKTIKQLDEYFDGKRKIFDLKLNPQGTEFQKKVWNALYAIPYGETRSYKDIAKACGNENASRAVGLANNKNPIPIIFPCHRVVGSNGDLVGYAGGLELKKQLLEIESLFFNIVN